MQKRVLFSASFTVLAKLEESFNLQLRELREELSAKDELLRTREGQLEELRSDANALGARAAEMQQEKEQTESMLREELNNRQKELESTESALAELEKAAA